MLLNVGDRIKLLEIIDTIYEKDRWRTGIYEVVQIAPSFSSRPNSKNPHMSYFFKKVKKLGGYTKFHNGYNTDAFDQMILEGKAKKL